MAGEAAFFVILKSNIFLFTLMLSKAGSAFLILPVNGRIGRRAVHVFFK
jgi:hypothetical protein